MATTKSTRSRKRRKAVPKAVPTTRKAVPARQFLNFPVVKGKTIETVEIDPYGQAIVMVFRDNTVLSFDLDPRLSVFPELSKRIRGDAHILKRWEPVHTKSSILNWL